MLWRLLRAGLKSLCAGKAPDAELYGGEGYEGKEGVGEIFIVLVQASVAAEPGEGALDDPSAGQDDEALHVVASLDDLDAQAGVGGDGVVHLPGVVSVVAPDQLEPVEPLAYLVEDQGRAVAILDAGGVDAHAQWEAFGIDQGVELASFDLLSGVVTHCVVFTPVFTAPFSADLSDWLSMIAAVGLTSRPACSRRAKSNSAQIASQAPSRWNLRKML